MRSTAVKAFERTEVNLSIADQLEKDIATLAPNRAMALADDEVRSYAPPANRSAISRA